MTSPARPLPVPTDITRPFWDAAKRGRLAVQICHGCQRRQFYPRNFCTHCMSESLGWADTSGKGVIYTYTINRRAANAFMTGRTPYAVAVIELAEGVRLMANIVNTPLERIAIGKPVRVVFEAASDDISLPQFEVAEP
jgi:uncharacterized OB-fold protein